MLYYFSVSMWGWRGMVELGTLLRDYPCDTDFDKPQCKMGRQLSATLLAEAEKFKVDIDAAVARSVVKFSPEAAKTYGAEMFVPSAVVPDGKPPLVFQSMTQDTLSEYSNVRELTTQACCRQLFSVFIRAGCCTCCSSATTLKCLAATRWTIIPPCSYRTFERTMWLPVRYDEVFGSPR